MRGVVQFRKPWLGALITLSVLFLCIASGASAALEDCEVSGVDRVYIDTNNNHQPDAGDAYWTLQVDKAANVGIVTAHGGVWPDPAEQPTYLEGLLFEYSENGNSASIQEIHSHTGGWHSMNEYHPDYMLKITGTKQDGADNYSMISFEYLYQEESPCAQNPAFTTVDLLDTDNDGTPDRVEGTVNIQTGADCPNVVVDHPLELHQSGGKNYWIIPGMVKVWMYSGGFTRQGPFDVFVPIGDNNCIDVTCGGTQMIEQCSGGTWGSGGGDADTTPTSVSSLTPWGTISFLLVILLAGTWIARKTGMGRGLHKN